MATYEPRRRTHVELTDAARRWVNENATAAALTVGVARSAGMDADDVNDMLNAIAAGKEEA